METVVLVDLFLPAAPFELLKKQVNQGLSEKKNKGM